MPKKSKDEFKAAFGIKQSSTDWKAVMKAMNKGLVKLDGHIQKLEDYGTQDAAAKRNSYQLLMAEAAKLRQAYNAGIPNAGAVIRDSFLPKVQKQLTEAYKSTLDTPNEVAGAGGQTVDVFRNDIPGFDTMDAQQRQASLQLAADKTERGLALFQAIAGGPPLPAATNQSVVDLMWALKSKAQGKRGGYEKGALTAPNGDLLRQFLDTSPEAYPRSSSHISEQAREHGPGISGQTTRGIDFYKDKHGNGPNEMLPSGMNTILFQQVKGTDGRTMLYVKMETESAYGSGGGNAAIDPTAPQGRAPRAGDTGALIAHGKNWVVKTVTGGVASNEELGTAREDVPKRIEKRCNEIIRQWPVKAGKAALKGAMGSPVRLNKFFEAVDARLGGPAPDQIPPALANEIAAFQVDLMTKYEVTHIESMFGEEVQLVDTDF